MLTACMPVANFLLRAGSACTLRGPVAGRVGAGGGGGGDGGGEPAGRGARGGASRGVPRPPGPAHCGAGGESRRYAREVPPQAQADRETAAVTHVGGRGGIDAAYLPLSWETLDSNGHAPASGQYSCAPISKSGVFKPLAQTLNICTGWPHPSLHPDDMILV